MKCLSCDKEKDGKQLGCCRGCGGSVCPTKACNLVHRAIDPPNFPPHRVLPATCANERAKVDHRVQHAKAKVQEAAEALAAVEAIMPSLVGQSARKTAEAVRNLLTAEANFKAAMENWATLNITAAVVRKDAA